MLFKFIPVKIVFLASITGEVDVDVTYRYGFIFLL